MGNQLGDYFNLAKNNQSIKNLPKLFKFIVFFLSVCLISVPGNRQNVEAANDKLCQQAVDVVLLMDRSGSMDYTSRCDWWGLECVGVKPNCSSYAWTLNTTYNETQAWCDAKTSSAPHQSVYLNIDPKKIVAAKSAADNFVDFLGTNDQSAVISFANEAILNKGLSNDHLASQGAINSMVASGATNIGDAIKRGIQELQSNRVNPQAGHIMILLTDGKANKPNGNGNDENPADVAYAQNQAVIAATAGFKIFTIGLGSDGEIDQTMLQNIANTTDAQYYHAPTQNDLQAIYSAISERVCQYGSISGCKYQDANHDGSIDGETKIAGWPITLTIGCKVFNQTTDESGCFQFSGLEPGTYTLSEGTKTGVSSIKTYPDQANYQINLSEGANLSNYNFANYIVVCGNGIKDDTEQCDDGNTASGDGCSASCQTETPPTSVCGNGEVETGEACDNGATNGDHVLCSAQCQLNSACNNGLDDDDDSLSDQADPGCHSDNNPTNSESYDKNDNNETDQPVCGNNLVESGEQCDDGNTTAEDGCSATCQTEGGGGPVCGDGVKEGSEQCDDGNTANGDGCSASCVVEQPASVCGNNKIETGEACDDGNTADGDGCSASCQIEVPVCGNNKIETGENCDDGNTTSGDGCSDLCQTEGGGGPTYSWLIADWGTCSADCGGGTQTRIVVCQDNNSQVVADEKCTETKPSTSQSCNPQSCGGGGSTYSWLTGNWGTCSADCGGGTQNRTAICQDNNQQTVADENCPSPKPELGQTCNTQGCGGGGGGGGGGVVSQDLIIFNEMVSEVTDTTATITWTTNKNATSRVVYDTVSHPEISGQLPPKYSYAFSNTEDSTKIVGHSMIITGLTPQTKYYFRPISSASPEKIGKEVTFNTGGVAGVKLTEQAVLNINKQAMVSSAKAGDVVKFKITIVNSGNQPAINVVVTDILPEGFSYQDGAKGTWSLGDLAANDSREIDYAVKVKDDIKEGVYTNKAQIKADNHDLVNTTASLEIKEGKVLGEKLAATGFSTADLLVLLSVLTTLIGSSIFLRRKYLS